MYRINRMFMARLLDIGMSEEWFRSLKTGKKSGKGSGLKGGNLRDLREHAVISQCEKKYFPSGGGYFYMWIPGSFYQQAIDSLDRTKEERDKMKFLREFMAKMLEDGLKEEWLIGLRTKPNRSSECGLPRGRITALKVQGIVAIAGHTKIDRRTHVWGPGTHYNMAISALTKIRNARAKEVEIDVQQQEAIRVDA